MNTRNDAQKATTQMSQLKSGAAVIRKVPLALIRFYQTFISPGLPNTCRFYPSCSEYAYQAISKYGIIKGGAKAIWRVMRCNPFCRGGYDPVE